MRPDEHKKKNSAAYKKKQANTAAKAANSSSSAHGSSKDQHRKNASKTNNSVPEDVVEVGEERFSDDEFKKRTVHSNWERYEEKEQAKMIGSTYEELLSSATDPSSNLILDVEKDWDNYPDFDTDLFGIDCHHIHTMLQHFNFCDRFDFDARDIDPELLEMMKSPNASSQVEKISDVTVVRDVMLDRNKIEFTNPQDLKSKKEAAITTAKPAATTETKTTKTKVVDHPPVEGTTPTKEESPAEEASVKEVADVDDDDESFFDDLEKMDSTTTTTRVEDKAAADDEGDEVDDLEDWLDSII